MNTVAKTFALLALSLPVSALFSAALAGVALQPGSGEAGSNHRAALRVGPGCGGSATTGIAVQLPAGFSDAIAEPKPGWTLTRQGAEVRWTVERKRPAAASGAHDEFVIAGKLPPTPGALWLKVQQSCEQGRLEWSQLPARGTSTAGLKLPAVLLQVRAPAAVVVEQGWVRPSVPGQQGTGGYMKLTAREGRRLVGVSSPVAGVAEIHDMKLDGDVMRMRPVRTLDLAAGTTVELKPGGLHLMLMDLKQPLTAGSSVALTLVLKDVRGQESRVDALLQVMPSAPGANAARAGHKP